MFNLMKIKPVILLLTIFVIGFVLGMLTSAQVRNKKLQPVRFFFNEKHFVEGLSRIIEPSPQQVAEFDALLKKYSDLNGKLNKEFSEGFRANIDAFWSEIESKLTKEQLDKIEEVEEERRRMFEEFAKNRSDSTFNRDKNRDDGRFGRDEERFERDRMDDDRRGMTPPPPPPREDR